MEANFSCLQSSSPLNFQGGNSALSEATQVMGKADCIDSGLSREKETLSKVKAIWKGNGREEVDRLLEKGIITTRLIAGMSKMSKGLWSTVIFGRAREIMEIYKKSHSMFTHGKCFFLSLIDDFIKEIIRIYQPSACRSLYKHLRLPDVSPHINNNKDFFDQFNHYGKEFTDNQFPEHLISVDWDLLSTEGCESALSALNGNTSIMMRGGDSTIIKILRKGLKPFIQNKKIRNNLIEKVIDLVKEEDENENSDRLGTLYLFCIPKEIIGSKERNFVYLSHAYGKPCDHYEGSPVEIIEGLQSKTIQKVCSGQARILTGPLANCKGARIFRLTRHASQRRKEIKMKFRNFIEEAQKEDREVSSQEKQAAIFYKLAAKQGDADAEFNLGCCYRKGKGIKRNEEKAFKYLQRAADKGHKDAEVSLNLMVDTLLEGKRAKKDQRKQIELLTFLTNKGNTEAQCKLAGFYAYGEFVEQDLAKAASLFKRAAEQGHPNANRWFETLMNEKLESFLPD